jgi:uncharacterized protein YprB with RNaseH-like and TPR domain
VIRSTFLHLPGVGPATEAELWRRGIRDWAQVPALPDGFVVRWAHSDRVRAELEASERALAERRVDYFARRLPSSEHWRLYPAFRAETAFLDIETTGLSPYEGVVTVVSVHGGGRTRTFIADENLEELPAYLQRFRLLSTFNGRLFDVPFLEFRFPGLVVPEVHIDLRFLLYRLGYSGGLKRIEQVLGLGDRSGVEGIHGLDAVRLWEAFRRGDTDSLARLVRYNRADTVNLEPLLEFAVSRLSERLLPARSS